MKPITMKDFNDLSIRDFENGAVRDAIRETIKERDIYKRRWEKLKDKIEFFISKGYLKYCAPGTLNWMQEIEELIK